MAIFWVGLLGVFWLIFKGFLNIYLFKILCSIYKKKLKDKKIQEVWEKVIHNLESEAEIKEILLLWADESGSGFRSRSELPPSGE